MNLPQKVPLKNRSDFNELVGSHLFDVSNLINHDAPLKLYSALRSSGHSFLLESVEKSDQRARFSFVSADPEAVVTIKDRRFLMKVKNGNDKLKRFLASRLDDCIAINHYNETNDDDSARFTSFLSGEIGSKFDAFDALRCAIPCHIRSPAFERQAFLGGGIGYLAYDLVKERLGKSSDSSTPDAQFGIFQKVFVFDHFTEKVYLAISPFLSGDDAYDMAENMIFEVETLLCKYDRSSPSTLSDDLDAEMIMAGDSPTFQKAVNAAKEHILDGDIFQVVLSRVARLKLRNPDPVALYRRLRRINPSPYTYVLEFDDHAVVGASPETLFSIYNRSLTVNPIAGTCPRGGSPQEDELLARKMLDDEKEQAEHVMLVDLGRNDVRSVCKAGKVQVKDFMSVLQYSHVQHIETTVLGELREECDQFDAARAVFPAGTLSGAPKLRALEIIDDLEKAPRGIYGGGIGYFSCDGSADFAIAIRSVVLRGNEAQVQAGAGIVADSDPYNEFVETERKMAAMKKALGVEVEQ